MGGCSELGERGKLLEELNYGQLFEKNSTACSQLFSYACYCSNGQQPALSTISCSLASTCEVTEMLQNALGPSNAAFLILLPSLTLVLVY